MGPGGTNPLAGPPGPGVSGESVEEIESDRLSSGTFMGPGGTCGLGCCILTSWACEVTAGGGEVVGTLVETGVSWPGSGGRSQERSEVSMSPLSIGACRGVLEDGTGTSLPATSAYPIGCGVVVGERRPTDLRKTWRGEVAAWGC